MKTETKSARVKPLLDLYDMQTDFFERALEGISENDTHKRLDTKANHIAWLTGSLVEQRFDFATQLGIKESQKAHELFKDNKGIQDNATYPPLSQYKEDWKKISPLLREALTKVSDEKLDEKLELMPDMVFSNYEMLTFLIYREANCIGQIALWRRLLGYPGMRYE